MNLALPSIDAIRAEKIRRSHLAFMQHTWMKKTEPMVVGLHTREICKAIDQAFKDFKEGKSTYLKIKVHNRAGKSDIVSRYLPPHFIGMFPDCEVMDVSYSQTKAAEFSKFGMNLVKSPEFLQIFPHVVLDKQTEANWNIRFISDEPGSRQGGVYGSGLGAGLTGRGAHLAILDDYYGSRQIAESPTMREKTWNAFCDDFLTRLAPVHIVIILATQWHEDDIHGRIENRNNPEHEDYDPDFPIFKSLSFPARRELYHTPDDYPGEFLFLERFSAEWYKTQYATKSAYSAAAILDCNPIPRGGAILKTDAVKEYTEQEAQDKWPKNLKWYRVWDLAHTARQTIKEDPDFTGGTLLAFYNHGKNMLGESTWSLFIRDYAQFRDAAPQRDAKIKEIAKKDGPAVKIAVENSLDNKDAANYLAAALSGIRSIKAINCKGDKVTRCAPVEIIFEQGRVHILKGQWNRVWKDSLLHFDGSGKTHDEAVDNITCGWLCYQDTGYQPINVSVG